MPGVILASFYPQKNSLVAQIVLGKEQVATALGLSLGQRVGQALRDTPQLHDGRWLFVKVTSRRDVKDVVQLIQVKRKPVSHI